MSVAIVRYRSTIVSGDQEKIRSRSEGRRPLIYISLYACQTRRRGRSKGSAEKDRQGREEGGERGGVVRAVDVAGRGRISRYSGQTKGSSLDICLMEEAKKKYRPVGPLPLPLLLLLLLLRLQLLFFCKKPKGPQRVLGKGVS